eukprot:scaffold250709_cov83-Cyclotella_meneghiniana.AAC.1
MGYHVSDLGHHIFPLWGQRSRRYPKLLVEVKSAFIVVDAMVVVVSLEIFGYLSIFLYVLRAAIAAIK